MKTRTPYVACLLAIGLVVALHQSQRCMVPRLPTTIWEAKESHPLQSLTQPVTWDGLVPVNVSFSAHVPAWAGCQTPPCSYSQLSDGHVEVGNNSFYSQFQEDEALFHNWFYNKRSGFFVEMGALDGVKGSNTKFFSDQAGWKGLLIEANPILYADLEKSRPECICLNVAACSNYQEVHYVNNGVFGGIVEFMSPNYKAKWYPNLKNTTGLPLIHCLPMQYIFDRYGISQIDFFSLDVEGAELEVLHSMDFSRLDIGIMVVEVDGTNKEKDDAVKKLLDEAGFEEVTRRVLSTFFVNRKWKFDSAPPTPSPSLVPAAKQGAEQHLPITWDGLVPVNVSFSAHVPAWAGCQTPPCSYSQLSDGHVEVGNNSFYSQFQEDEALFHNWFYNKRSGFFVEMGALDGVKGSNTKFFSDQAGWKGLLIEANPILYADLEKSRPECICLNVAACSNYQEVHYVNNGVFGGIVEFMSPNYKAKWYPNLKNTTGLPLIHCLPMQYIFDRYGISQIDFFSLDVEGAELEVLHSMDFSRLDIGIMVVEVDGTNKEKDDAVKKLLDEAGFEEVTRRVLSTFFVNRKWKFDSAPVIPLS